tara:strand:+ start:115719 stop:117377 length:1659 start_codon:yes stop_codon:yes gene_type:complete
MSIRNRILIGFAVVIILGALQGGFLTRNVIKTADTIEVVFEGPLKAVENARAAWTDFRDAREHFSHVIEMVEPTEAKASVAQFDTLFAAFVTRIDAVAARTSDEAAMAQLAQVRDLSTRWRDAARQMLDVSPTQSIVAPHVMTRLETQISVGLDTLVDQTIAGAQTLQSATNNQVQTLVVAGLALFGLAIVLGMGIAVAISMGLTRPLGRLEATMRRLSEGDLDTEVSEVSRKDEIGAMAKAVQVFKDNAIEMKRLEDDQKKAATQAEKEKREAMHALASEFEGSVASALSTVSASADQMKTSAISMNSVADEASKRSSNVAAASEQATASVQTVASATEEMSSSIQEISRQVAQSSEMANRAVETASTTNTKIEGLAAAAEKIGEVVGLISDIAAQTNLLALNATIEASRAGEAGKGFAVVASEVKSLATQTAQATEDISAQIASIQAETQEAVDAIREIGHSIEEISKTATTISTSVDEQGAATRDIATNVQQAATGTQDVSSNIVEVSRGVQETGSSAQEVLSSAEQLGKESDELQAAVANFLDRVKAA